MVPYHSTTLTFPDGHGKNKKQSKQESVPLPPRNQPCDFSSDLYPRSSIGDFSDDGLDEYEQPMSANSSLRYATIDNTEPPQTFAPAVPTVPETVSTSPGSGGRKQSGGVKVLPSIPFSPLKTTVNVQPSSVSQPVPQPRRKKEQKVEQNIKSPAAKTTGTDKVKGGDVAVTSNRDSHMSTTSAKSSHHYFVLEPENNIQELDDYENAVSSPRIV